MMIINLDLIMVVKPRSLPSRINTQREPDRIQLLLLVLASCSTEVSYWKAVDQPVCDIILLDPGVDELCLDGGHFALTESPALLWGEHVDL